MQDQFPRVISNPLYEPDDIEPEKEKWDSLPPPKYTDLELNLED